MRWQAAHRFAAAGARDCWGCAARASQKEVDMHWGGYYWGWLWVIWIPIMVVVVVLVSWIVKGSSRSSEEPRESAEEILKRRYARGEISKQEFERMLQDLRR
jgi:putative membrane protein